MMMDDKTLIMQSVSKYLQRMLVAIKFVRARLSEKSIKPTTK